MVAAGPARSVEDTDDPTNQGAGAARMRVLMIGPPGAGKGTQGARVAKHFHIPHIATGQVLRDHVARSTAIGRAAQGHLDRGELVPDHLLYDVVRAAFTTGDGYVLDGLPRTLDQA